ncbi:alpha/beta fold hydrolase [Nocardia sp. NPDC003963]
MVPVDDTALSVTDTEGPGRPVVYLNGSYASQRSWRRVIAELGPQWRHVTYDERARGGSKRSADYSFEGCLRDVDAVVEATGVDQPLLVGWCFGVLGEHRRRLVRCPSARRSAGALGDRAEGRAAHLARIGEILAEPVS